MGRVRNAGPLQREKKMAKKRLVKRDNPADNAASRTRNPNRIDSSSIQDAIFRPKDNFVKTAEVVDDNNEYYSSRGQLVAETNREIVAQKVYINGIAKHYCLTGPNGKFFNPIGMYDAGTIHKKTNSKPLWSLRLTTKKVFDLYLSFLKTKNKSLLIHAEREL